MIGTGIELCVLSFWVFLQELLIGTKEILSHDLYGRRGRAGLCTGKIGELGERERPELSQIEVLVFPGPQPG